MQQGSKLDLKALDANKKVRNKNYWNHRFETFELTDVFNATGASDPDGLSGHSNYPFTFSKEISDAVYAMCPTGKSRHILLMGTVGLLALKSSLNQDIMIFTPLYNDDCKKDQNTVVPVKVNCGEGLTFAEYLTGLKNDFLEDYKHANFPLDKMIPVEWNDLLSSVKLSVLLDGLQLEQSLSPVISEIIFSFHTGENLLLNVKYDTSKFEEKFIERILDLYQGLLQNILANPRKKVSELGLIPQEEKFMVLNGFNATHKPFPSSKTVIDLYLEQLEKVHDKEAIIFEDKTLPYASLEEQSNQVANYLVENYPETGTVIGVMLDRSFEMMIAIFGILKAGHIYLPLSTTHPENRIQYTLEDSGAKAVFTIDAHSKKLPSGLPSLEMSVVGQSDKGSVNRTSPEQTAYIIYTSGSTGKPKGVPILHRSLTNRLIWMKNEYSVGHQDIILHKTPTIFDVSVWELILWSISGAKLVLATPGSEKDPAQIGRVIDEHQVTMLHFVPSMLNAFLIYLGEHREKHDLTTLCHLISSGEELRVSDAALWNELIPGASLHNLYGPTEATIDVTSFDVKNKVHHNKIPIGKPIDNTQIYILNRYNDLQPIGFIGELCIGGENLSTGYINKPDLTKDRFVPNPLEEGKMLYRTGDLAQWLPDGNIIFLGRMDHQVKIRGHRIDLEEIEHTLRSHEQVLSAIVITKKIAGSLQLVAFVVGADNYVEKELLEYLSLNLPVYMIPAHIIRLATLPVTVNGKVDKKKLLAHDITANRPYTAPSTNTEKYLEAIWKRILELDKISVDDDFFKIGGDSIIAVRLIGAMNRELNVNLAMIDMYENKTIQELAHLVENTDAGKSSEAIQEISQFLDEYQHTYLEEHPSEEIETVYPMSDVEKSMFYIHMTSPEDVLNFEQMMGPVRHKSLNVEVLTKAFERMIQKHHTFRTGYDLLEFAHIVYKNVPFTIDFRDLSSLDNSSQKETIHSVLLENRANVIHLDSKQLWRVTLFKLNDNYHEILFEYHHALLDGWSFASFLTELNNTYVELLRDLDFQPEPLASNFRDYIAMELFNKQDVATRDFWKKNLSGYERLKLFEYSDKKDYGSVRNIYPRDMVKHLEETAEKQGTTIRNVLQTAYMYALSILSGQDDVVAGMVTFSRPLIPDGDKILGCFLNEVPFRMKIPTNGTWVDLMKLTDQKFLEVKKYDFLSLFEINQTAGSRTFNKHPFHDTSFNFIDFHVTHDMMLEDTDDSEIDRLDFDVFLQGNSSFAANYNVNDERILLMHEYASPFMTKETYDQFEEIFQYTLNSIIENPDHESFSYESFWCQKLNTELKKLSQAGKETSQVPVKLSIQQKQIWETASKPQGQLDHLQLIISYERGQEEAMIEQSLQQVLDRYGVLNTVIVDIDGEPHLTFNEISTNCLILKNIDAECNGNEKLVGKKPGYGEPLYTIGLEEVTEGQCKLTLSIHPLVADKYMLHTLREEVLDTYHTLKEGKDSEVPNATPYHAFTLWQESVYRTTAPYFYESWKNIYEEAASGNGLTSPELTASERQIEVYDFEIGGEEYASIMNYCREEDISSELFFMASSRIMMEKSLMTDGFVFNTTISGRDHQLLKPVTGPVATLANVKGTKSVEMNFSEYLQMLQAGLVKDAVNAFVPVHLFSDNSAFDTNTIAIHFDFVSNNRSKNKANGPEISTNIQIGALDSHNISVRLTDMGDRVCVRLILDDTLISQEALKMSWDHYSSLISKLIAIKSPVSEIDILTESERNQLLDDFNDTSLDHALDKTIIDLFEEQVAKTPQQTALIFEGKELSYQEFSDCVDQLAHILIEKDIKTDTVVGIMLDRSFDLMVAIFAVLKSGGTYLPIDPGFPGERTDYILQNSQAKFLLTSTKYEKTYSFLETLAVDSLPDMAPAKDRVKSNALPSSLAYVIYTSGSTGKPKGVMIEHRNVVNFIEGMCEAIPFHEKNTILCLTTVSFDIFVLESLLPLSKGLKVVLANEQEQYDGELLANAIKEHNVDMLQMTPSRLKLLMASVDSKDALSAVKTVMIGGEAFPQALFGELKDVYTGNIFNMYGPTETTVWSAIKDLTHEDTVTIGKPIANTGIYILGKNDELLALGNAGELCIGGEGLARGYLHNDKLTHEKFVKLPWLEEKRVYKTGDLACWLPDGNIKFLGRMDDQVKIRGFRIELGEIEFCLSNHEQIHEVCVITKTIEDEEFLVAYYTYDVLPEKKDLIDHLSGKLPGYMVPSHFVPLDELPLTPNGKVNKKALPSPEIEVGDDYVAPSGEIENQLVAIWSEVLKLDQEKIGVTSSFFELGGHSLNILKARNLISKELKVDMGLVTLFTYPTIQGIAGVISNSMSNGDNMIEPVEEKEYYDASVNQKASLLESLYLNRGFENGYAFNISQSLPLDDVNIIALEKAFEALIKRHEILRTVLLTIDGDVKQKVLPYDIFPFKIINIDIRQEHEQREPFGRAKKGILRTHFQF